ncbi:hypothetical protein SOASR030_21550 [Leminorella grimontii]|uniref:Autotransporter domain-containing protein n=1 Tax=Leminorella grimontii TaxID=82981 RepID=A0AAV5N3G2_9GAMM|nr:hypothetical protein [Leminorella grimontii]GKX56043.1 hypothetical protein SOASR030_21550 [Leminorella grimontii]VFS57770.1 Uncharacterised protein [Leminorella grimontii]
MENNKRKLNKSKIALALLSAISASTISFSSNATPPHLPEINFPEVQYPEGCDQANSSQCKVYTGTESLDTLHTSRGDSSIHNSITNSFGYKTTEAEGHNNTIIIKNSGSISGIIRGISSTENKGSFFTGNNVFIDLNGAELNIPSFQDAMPDGGGYISAAAASYGKELRNNSIFIKNTVISGSRSIIGASANAASSSYNGGFQDSKINNNSVVLDTVYMKPNDPSGDSTGTVITGAYLHTPKNPFDGSSVSNSVEMSKNSLYIKNSNLSFDAMTAAMTYNSKGSKEFIANDNVAYIENSILNTGDNSLNRIYSAVGYDIQNNALVIKESEININTSQMSYNISSAYYADDRAIGNQLIITDTKINTLSEDVQDAKNVTLTGAWSEDISKNNQVYIEDVTLGKKVTTINGGVSGVYKKIGIADNNSIILANTDMHNNLSIRGGYVLTEKEGSDTSDVTISASGNSILIKDSHLAGSIYGGVLGSKDKPRKGNAENNTITIGAGQSGDLNSLYGGFGAESNSTYKGNTLNLYSNISTSELGGFQHYNFYYSDKSQFDTAMIEVSGDKSIPLYTKREPGDNSTLTILTKGLDIKGGTKLQLIKSAAGFIDADTGYEITKEDLKNISSQAAPDIANFKSLATVESYSPLQDYSLEISDNALSAVVDGEASGATAQNSQTDIFSTASLAALTTMVASDELLVDTALTGAESGQAGGPFAAIRYGDYRYNTQHKLKTEQTSALFGYGFQAAAVDYGVFLETGYNSYSARTGSPYGDVNGSGNHSYGGTGIYLNYATPIKRLHTTAYLKGGVLYDDFNSRIAMADVNHSQTSTYWGTHVGIYWDVPVEENWNSRLFANYFYDGREKEQFNIADSQVTYSELNSHRVQAGILATYTGSSNFRPYIGVSWEEMMNAEARGSVRDEEYRWNLDKADMNGGSAVVNAGIGYTNPGKNLNLGLNVKGYSGMRNGAAVQVQIKWRL